MGRNLSAQRDEQLIRALRIIRDLDRLGGVDVYELAERHGISVRHVWRQLRAIEASGLPLLEEKVDRRTRWRLDPRVRRQQLEGLLDVSHYLALRLAMDQGGAAHKTSSVFATLEDLANKIEKAVGPAGRERLVAIERACWSLEKQGYLSAPADVLWPLIEAIDRKRYCKVMYRSARVDAREKSINVLPARIFSHDRTVYLLCFSAGHHSAITLNLQRLRSLKVTDQVGELPADFDLEAWGRSAFHIATNGPLVTYRLRFSAEAAVYIREREWHPGQKIEELEDGGLELSFRCAETYEVTAWVASWRSHVEAIAPVSLRKEMRELRAWLEETYG